MKDRLALIHALQQYRTDYPDEAQFKPAFLKLLQHPRSFYRDHQPGHITGSAWITDASGQYVLLTHHARLNRWLQPGGHADGQEDVQAVAFREATEETGLKSLQPMGDFIFDIDIHAIPGNKNFPEHAHYDVRFLFRASMEESLVVTAESHALAWVALETLQQVTNNNVSILRMAEKARQLFRGDQQHRK